MPLYKRAPTLIPYQWTSAFLAVSIAGLILYLVRRNHLHGTYAVWWLVLAVGVLVSGLFPKLLDRIGGWLGVNYPPILFVALSIGALFLKVLSIDLERSRQEIRLRRLTQRLALLEAELAERHDIKQNDGNSVQ